MSSVVFWDPRQVVLTDSHLILSKTSDPDVVTDVIGLHEVLNVFSDVNDEGKMRRMLVKAVVTGLRVGRASFRIGTMRLCSLGSRAKSAP